ncbi:NifU family protein [Mycolicibacterium fluoranthenivorans]|uniref:Nitrite reductase/ring-hydroxylating ferredoxin subunit/Fe-S cluster biogenesis protein NfuA n=1 Tax=Mycolicibacterium fluoranthenivorans TaxID=258505 RepID=A0A7X5TZC4_9MYCO|nr:NifU family protein [Mycolicibacterium fluoranthenivorans]MCV7358320.1 NifU family protein [Mycolicibacterium fluoranthenivorans]NIH95550.1 nitrite reductase/ring-hydroxylating ferredoxin subunit/Fe-S cluster biogenesis protein NfuA [Mycolicibacterium fluoranthenivorans]
MTTVAEHSTAGGVDEPEFEKLAKRVDDAMRALAGLDPMSRAIAEEVKASVEAIHRAGLVSIVRRLKADEATRAALFELVDDPVVHLLLSIHEIVRPDPMTLANRVLAQVRPQLQSHGGDVALVRVEDGTAFVRLEGACNGCSMSSVTLRTLVEGALTEGVPGVHLVEVLPNEPSPTLISVESLTIGLNPANEGWVRVGPVADVPDGNITATSLTADSGAYAEVVLVNVGNRITAYRNECAHEALPLDNAVLDVSNGTLTCPWHGFCYDATSGECLTAPGAQLEQLPLRVDDADVWVRVGRG